MGQVAVCSTAVEAGWVGVGVSGVPILMRGDRQGTDK